MQNIIKEYRKVNAISNSALSMVEGLLLGSPFAIKKQEGKTEALDLGNIVDRILWDKDYLNKIILIEEGGIGYKAWKDSCEVEDLFYDKLEKVKSKFDKNIPMEDIDDKFVRLTFKFHDLDKNKWSKGRTKEEVQFCKDYSAYVSVQMEIQKHKIEMKKYIEKYGTFYCLIDKHTSGEIVLLNLLFEKPSEIYEIIKGMVNSIDENKDYQKMIKNSDVYYQQPLYFTHSVYNVNGFDLHECKGLPDVICINHKEKTINIIDLKTTQYSDYRMYKMKRYFRQLAFYKLGIPSFLIKLKEIYSKYSDVKWSEYKIYCHILNVRYSVKKENVKVYSELLMVGENDIKTAYYGGIIKPDWQTDCVMNRLHATWNQDNVEISNLGIHFEDKKYKVYSIDELILELNKLTNLPNF